MEIRDISRRPRVLLGITGSIAAVKGPKLALRLANEIKADVRIVLTRTVGQYFWEEGRVCSSYDAESYRDFSASISPTSEIEANDECNDHNFSWRTSQGRIFLHYAEDEWNNYKCIHDPVLHIDLRNWADVCIIAPLSAHTLSKIANGLCDDLLTCCIRAWDFGQGLPPQNGSTGRGKPLILAPAMNTAMWLHPLTKQQLEVIKRFSKFDPNDDVQSNLETGVVIIEPTVKTLACGDVGAGALADLDDIMNAVRKCLIDVGRIDGSTKYDARQNLKRALLLHAKLRFDVMKSSHEHQKSFPSKLAAPTSPTPKIIIDTFLHRLNIDKNSLVIDLGCGDGRWLITANAFANCRCIGIDMDEDRLAIAQNEVQKRHLQDVVQLHRQDIFHFVKESADILTADVIILYLFREAMVEISTLLRQRLVWNKDNIECISPKRRIQVLSVGFALTGWTPITEEKVDGVRVYLYET